MKKFKEELEAYNKALEINPTLDRAWYNKGIALYQLGRYNESIEAFNKAIEINPTKEVIVNRDFVLGIMKNRSKNAS
ncbi:MAG: hypothetical protein DRO92_01970 [Candidatus Altiarchaeales archaeon]|nr:MAG: hypothetical protein DRO92_01970 [Candidatus Altiarchaeales archaeon]